MEFENLVLPTFNFQAQCAPSTWLYVMLALLTVLNQQTKKNVAQEQVLLLINFNLYSDDILSKLTTCYQQNQRSVKLLVEYHVKFLSLMKDCISTLALTWTTGECLGVLQTNQLVDGIHAMLLAVLVQKVNILMFTKNNQNCRH